MVCALRFHFIAWGKTGQSFSLEFPPLSIYVNILCFVVRLLLFQSHGINLICPAMPEIKIDLNGVLKLLSNLKPDKGVGPDSIKPVVLKQLKKEIAPVICLLFEKTLQTGQLPSDWKKHKSVPYSKRVTKQNRQIICPFL